MFEEWMIYRFIVMILFGQVVLMFLSASLICERVLGLISLKRRNNEFFLTSDN